MTGRSLLTLVCVSGLTFLTPYTHGQTVPRIIFDSDMSSDWDDVGDAAVLHGLASMGECEIIGMAVSSQNGATALCMDAINTWYGLPDIPIGVRPDVGGLGGYPAQIANEYPHDLQLGQAPLAVDVYRQLLAESPDKSVIIVTAGYLNNLEALMKSGPDQNSSLTGMELIQQKVKLWACAGGAYPSGYEFNFAVEHDAAEYVINNWNTAATFSPFDVGNHIFTARDIDTLSRPDSPIRRVYVDIENGKFPYPSWTQIVMYDAIRGLDDWDRNDVGRNNATIVGGYTLYNYWTATPDPTGDEDQAYLIANAWSPVQESLDAMMMLAPNDGSPSKPGPPSNLKMTAAGGSQMDLEWTDNAFNETGYVIERRDANGVYHQIATVGTNITQFSDTSTPVTGNTGYRVRAYNDQGQSIDAYNWYYSGWTEISAMAPPSGSLYEYYQYNHLLWANPGDFRPDHVALNNDSQHGRNIVIHVDAASLGAQGNMYVYFFYQDGDNWYRFNWGESSIKFEKRINGTIIQIGSDQASGNIANWLHHWQIEVAADGTLKFLLDGELTLQVTDTLSFTDGLIGLGGWARNPVWENFHFEQVPVPATMTVLGLGGLALIHRR